MTGPAYRVEILAGSTDISVVTPDGQVTLAWDDARRLAADLSSVTAWAPHCIECYRECADPCDRCAALQEPTDSYGTAPFLIEEQT